MFQIEVVWNREFNWSRWGSPKSTLQEARQTVESLWNAGDGAGIKKIQVRNLETDEVTWLHG